MTLQRWAILDACERYVGAEGIDVRGLETLLTLALTDPWGYLCRQRPQLRKLDSNQRVVLSDQLCYLDYSDGQRILDEMAGLEVVDLRPKKLHTS